MKRRDLLFAVAPLIGSAAAARAEGNLRDSWLGTWRGHIVFRRSLPLEDIYPPPKTPRVEVDDTKPIPFEVTLSLNGGQPTIRTRIDAGPMQTAREGEALVFNALSDSIATLAGPPRTVPHMASLTVRPDAFGTEALFRHSDGSFWRRHINLRFLAQKAEVIVWVFDAEGTRARTWRGDVTRQR